MASLLKGNGRKTDSILYAPDPVILPWMSYIRPLLMIQVQILVGDLHRGYLGSPEVTNRFLLIPHCRKKAGDMAVDSLCLSCRDTSTDMQHDILGSICDLTWP